MKIKQTKKTGFTLIEMLVVIAIIALLASILIPAVTGALKKAERLKVMTNGKGIYTNIFATITDISASGINYYPEEGSTKYPATSTGYFKWLMRDFDDNSGAGKIISEDLSVFVASGVTRADSLSDMDGEDNPWSVVTGITAESEASLPFIVSRNLNESRLVDWGTNTELRPQNVGVGTSNTTAGAYKDPYGEDAIIVIRAGGGGEVIVRRDMTWAVINQGSQNNADVRPTNVILQPH